MDFFEETPLTPEEVECRLQELEAKYGLSSEEFRTGEHAEVSEDDQFEWLAYLDSRGQMARTQNQAPSRQGCGWRVTVPTEGGSV